MRAVHAWRQAPPARAEHLLAQREHLLARWGRRVPEVGHAELLGLVAQGVRGLRGLVGARVLRVDVGHDLGARLEVGEEGEMCLVVFAKERVLAGQGIGENLGGVLVNKIGRWVGITYVEAAQDVPEVLVSPNHDQQLAAKLHVHSHPLDSSNMHVPQRRQVMETASSGINLSTIPTRK